MAPGAGRLVLPAPRAAGHACVYACGSLSRIAAVPPSRRQPILRALLPCVVLLGCATANAQVSSNPGYDRPGLGFTPAVLQADALTWEQGAPDCSRNDGATNCDADTLLRLGIGNALELQLGTGWSWQHADGSSARGRDGTSLALKFAPAAQGKFSWGLLGSVQFTDAAAFQRNAHPQYLLGADLNWQRDANHSLGLYAELQHGNGDSQLLAINTGWALTPTFNAYIEAAAEHATGRGSGGVAGAGIAWQATPRVQFDISARHRVIGHADDWEGGLGVAVYFGD